MYHKGLKGIRGSSNYQESKEENGIIYGRFISISRTLNKACHIQVAWGIITEIYVEGKGNTQM